MGAKGKIALFIVLVITLVYIVYPSNLMVDKVYADDEITGSTIGGIAVNRLSSEELREVLNDAIARWTSEPIIINGGGSTMKINATAFHYDVDSTLALYESMIKKDWYAFWETKDTVHIPLEIKPNDSIKKELANISIWHTDSTYDKVMMQAANLASHEIEADVTNLTLLENERIALAIEEIPKEAVGVSEIVDVLNNQILNPHETFSFIEEMENQAEAVNDEALNFVASILYSVALNTNSEIVERTSQNVLPSYLEAGIEVAVKRDGSKDLRFVNTTSNAIKLKLSIEEDHFKIEAYSTNKEQDVEVSVVRDQQVKPRTIIRYSNELNIEEEQVLEEGAPGYRVSVYRYSTSMGNEELVSKDYYPPKNRIILKSSRQAFIGDSSNSSSGSLPNMSEYDSESNDTGTQEEFVTESGEVVQLPKEQNQLPEGSYYDKGGNLVTP